MSAYLLEFEIPGLPPMNTADGGNWRARNAVKKRWQKRVWAMAVDKKPRKPLQRARVTLTRCSGSREPDFENLTQGGKHVMDGLVLAGVIEDDKPSVIGRPTYLWEPAPRGQGKIKVRVESIDDALAMLEEMK